ncbi:hypothetical protein V8G54_027385 [Vigna mungo]|uniref:Uncharacterized protein n=1 Tax=Vigna mungo TaxID=3915 RepID=A0AAQ3N280_VIGMU
MTGYVERETTLIGSLTVREFLYYAALLQLPGFFCQKKSVVEDAIHAMSLGDHANKLIGGHCYMKGLPSGERRLVSIARELEGPVLKSKGKASNATRIAVLTWRSLLVVSREWKYYWLHLILYMLLTLCIGTVFSGLGHSLSSVVIYSCEESNQHSSTLVFLLAQLLSSIPFLFLISISSSLVFYFLVGLEDQFSLLMYFVLNFFMTLLLNEGIMLVVATLWQDGLLENEYLGTSFAVGQVRTISGFQALQSAYNISQDSNSKWKNLLVLFLMAIGYRIFVFILLCFFIGRKISLRKCFKCNRDTTDHTS